MGRPLSILLILLFGCSNEPLDTTRKIPTRGTLGEEIFRLFHRDFERESPRQAEGFMIEHDGFVGAIDHLFPPDELSYTQDFLVRLLPLYDDQTMSNTTQLIAGTLGRLAENPAALQSLAACGNREGYVHLDHQEALLRRIARYPQYRQLTKALLDLLLAHDGRDGSGNLDPNESDAFLRVQKALSKRLQEFEIGGDEERHITAVADLLLSEDERLAEGTTDAVVVRRDDRGMAHVRWHNGAFLGPFVDVNPADGLADINQNAQFVQSTGDVIDLPPFGDEGERDPQGRLVANGQPVFEYVDLDRTMLAGLLRDSRTLIADGVPMKAVRTLDTVLGARLPDSATYYPDNGLLDLLHGVSKALETDDLPALLAFLQILLEDNEATLAWILLEMEDQMEIADSYDVHLDRNNSFYNDLMRVLRQILAEPGLAEAMLVALQDPAVQGLAAANVRLLSHKKDLITEQDFHNGNIFVEAVDRSRPDAAGNLSLQQRMFHLIYDTKGASFEPELIGIPLGFIFEIDDLAEFYILSFIGASEVPGLVSTLTGLSERPTPSELAVFINEDQTFGNAIGNEGHEVRHNDGDTLFACSASGMVDALTPLVQAFHDHGQIDLLFELFEVLHLHWASPEGGHYQNRSGNSDRYSKLSGIRRYEPMLIEIFSETKVLDSVTKLLEETRALQLQGKSAHDVVLVAARRLLAIDTTLTGRDNKREVFVDGERVMPISPFDLIRGARSELKSIVRRDANTEQDWDDLVDAIHGVFLEVERTGETSGQLKNRRAIPVVLLLLAYLEERAQEHTAANDLSRWLQQDLIGTVEDAITSPELPALFDLIYAIDADENLSSSLTGLRDELLAEERGFADLLVTGGDGIEALKDANISIGLVRFLGRELAPDQQLLFTAGSMMQRALEVDPDEHVLEVARRALDDAPTDGLQIYGFGRAISRVHRLDPLDTRSLNQEDLRRITTAIHRYLLDDEHGLEKFYGLVANRKAKEDQP